MNRMTMDTESIVFSVVIVVLLLLPVTALAGSIDSPGAPSSGSGMPTLGGICNQLDTGMLAPLLTGPFGEPGAGPGSTMCTLTQLRDKAPVADASGAGPGDVRSGKKYWGLLGGTGNWGVRDGAMTEGSNVTGGSGLLTVIIPDGYYSGKTATVNDTNLATENIKSGVTIFGVAGATNVIDTTEAAVPAAAANISAGKKAFVNGALVTGSLSGGCTCSGTMNGTRWCDNGNGTVTDLLGGGGAAGKCLVWLKNANCMTNLGGVNKSQGGFGSLNWNDARLWTDFLSSGYCSLSDGSTQGEWRLPTKSEFAGLIAGYDTVSSSTPRSFINLMEPFYWSTTSADAGSAWYLEFSSFGSSMNTDDKLNYNYAWPVRSPQ